MILPAQRAQLILETTLRVVRPLPVDVPHNGVHIRRANRKQTIPSLPRKRFHSLPLHPRGRARLDLRHHLCCHLRGRQSQRNVDMIGDTSNTNTHATKLTDSSRNVCMKGRQDVIFDERRSAFGAEDDMHEVKAQRLRHESDSISALQPSVWDKGQRPANQTPGPQARQHSSRGRRPR